MPPHSTSCVEASRRHHEAYGRCHKASRCLEASGRHPEASGHCTTASSCLEASGCLHEMSGCCHKASRCLETSVPPQHSAALKHRDTLKASRYCHKASIRCLETSERHPEAFGRYGWRPDATPTASSCLEASGRLHEASGRCHKAPSCLEMSGRYPHSFQLS